MLTVLVTGVGGPLGQAIVNAAKLAQIPCRLLGSDRHPLSVGFNWVDRSYVFPNCSEKEAYLAQMHRVCAEEQVNAIIPGSDRELELLTEEADLFQRKHNTIVISSSLAVLRIGLNKWETYRFLVQAGLNAPKTVCLNSPSAVSAVNALNALSEADARELASKRQQEIESLVSEFGFPLIAKPAIGGGSQGLFRVQSWSEIHYLQSVSRQYILQEYLLPDDQEYTVGVYRLRNGQTVGGISFKRELVAGVTYRAWVFQDQAVLQEATRVVTSLGALGPCNVQLRLTARGPVTFEINPRFSGSTAMRAQFGYNEVEMAFRDLLLGEAVPDPVIQPGVALRYWQDTYLNGEAAVQAGSRL